MVDMMSASRAYEANITVINAQKQMAKDSLEI
jgi:flagellar basal body rod protein FlgC